MSSSVIHCDPLWNDPYWAYTRVMDWWVNGTMTGNSISFVTLLWIYLIKLYSEYTCCIINRDTHYRYQLHTEQALMLLFTSADDWFWRLSEFEFDYFHSKAKVCTHHEHLMCSTCVCLDQHCIHVKIPIINIFQLRSTSNLHSIFETLDNVFLFYQTKFKPARALKSPLLSLNSNFNFFFCHCTIVKNSFTLSLILQLLNFDNCLYINMKHFKPFLL